MCNKVFSFLFFLILVPVFYLAYLKVMDMYDLMTVPEAQVYNYCMQLDTTADRCHCFDIHGQPKCGGILGGSLRK
jgi:hypothetical protein